MRAWLDRLPRWLSWLSGALLCAACAWSQLAASWRKWADVQVDFGRELYTPWRLAEGDALYRDVAYFNGPLSPAANSWAFRLFGTSLSTLMVVNLLVLALACLLLARLFRRAEPGLTAILAPLTLLGVFAFQHLNTYGNYNWVTPYSHEMTHGVTLSLGLLWLAASRRAARSDHLWTVVGLLLGLVFLTKAEIFLAVVAGALTLCLLRPGPAGRLVSMVRLVVGSAAPVLLAWLSSSLSIGAGPAFHGTLGSWPSIFSGEISELAFYARGMGFDRPWLNLAGTFIYSVILLGLLAPVALAERKIRSAGLRTLVGGATAIVFFLWIPRSGLGWEQAARALPLLLLSGLTWSLWWWKRSGDRELRGRLAARAGLLVFSLVLLAKMILNTRVDHYGFVLAMPAMACVVVGLAGWLPAALTRDRGQSFGLSLATVGLFAGMALPLVQQSHERYLDKSWPVGHGSDRLYGDPVRGRQYQRTLEELEARFPTDATMVVLPEGVTLNYWSRRANPTPFINFMPPEVILYGEDAMVEALERARPDIVVLTHKDTTEYGLPLFGTHYGRKLYRWVREHYDSELVIDHQPLRNIGEHGVEILRRRRRAPS